MGPEQPDDAGVAEDRPLPQGLAELSTISVLNKDWQGLTIDLTGPDGSEIIGRLVFLNCPLCSGVVAPAIPATDEYPGRDFAMEHAAYHVKQAQDWDHVNQIVKILTEDEALQQELKQAGVPVDTPDPVGD